MKSLSIIIVNWNSGEQVKECIQSLDAHSDTDIQLDKVIIIDNASTDGSTEKIKSEFLSLQIIKNANNIGFAAACNVGASKCSSDYILFLNPDTKIYDETLSKVMTFIEDTAHNQVGICGIQLVDHNGRVTPTCSRFPTTSILLSRSIGLNHILPGKYTSQLMVEWMHDESRYVDQVMGAFFLVRRSLFKVWGGLMKVFLCITRRSISHIEHPGLIGRPIISRKHMPFMKVEEQQRLSKRSGCFTQ